MNHVKINTDDAYFANNFFKFTQQLKLFFKLDYSQFSSSLKFDLYFDAN